ncbi:MAG: hypothetical protein FJ146_12645 [Deltaproteobacteria bacterium]|nr:hypothetical protein [Deltaproteobacteria bacterium]
MPKHNPSKPQVDLKDDAHSGHIALSAYARILELMSVGGHTTRGLTPSDINEPFIREAKGLKNLLLTMSSVAPAIPDTSDEEWNPLSQRPHALLPAAYLDELGSAITALKTAVDEFTILSHELMHVALWEPFFAGYWRPRSKSDFRTFSLMAEGFCYFFSDIVIGGAVRVRLPDGEFALERQTASNARFHPVRAFKAAAITSHRDILDIYLDGFNGKQTALWQPRGKNDFAASLAAQAYDFYKGTLGYLSAMHGALSAFGYVSEFFRRYCSIEGLPSFLNQNQAPQSPNTALKRYFTDFFESGLDQLDGLTPQQITRIRERRALQMRAYYALQVRWLLTENHVTTTQPLVTLKCEPLAQEISRYLDGLEEALHELARQPHASQVHRLAALDARYSAKVRAIFVRMDAWAGLRWLIAPKRADGCINIRRSKSTSDQAAKRYVCNTATFLVEELTARLTLSSNTKNRVKILQLIKTVSELGSTAVHGPSAKILSAEKALQRELGKKDILELWSLPLASFDPVRNKFRELLFSYQ